LPDGENARELCCGELSCNPDNNSIIC